MGYKKKAVWEIKCETCGKTEEIRTNTDTYSYRYQRYPTRLPKGWVDVVVTATPGGNRVDPPVCSEDCATKYVSKRYKELTKPKPAAKKKTAAKKSTVRKTTATRRRTTARRRARY